jgi:hypothetical protein
MAIIIAQFDYPEPEYPDKMCWTVYKNDIDSINNLTDEIEDFATLEQAIDYCNKNDYTPYTIQLN